MNAISLKAEVHLSEDKDLRVTLSAQHSDRQAMFHIPRQEIPNFVAQFRNASDFTWIGAAASLRLRRRFIEHSLVADYDAQGHLVLEPRYEFPGNNRQELRLLSLQELQENRLNSDWVLGQDGLYPIAPIPRRLRPFFSGEKPLRYDDAEILQFFETVYERLRDEIVFHPSEAVRSTKIFPPPSTSHVKLEVGGADWFWCEVRYRVGHHPVALQEILQAQGKGYLRKGQDWIKLPNRSELLEDLSGEEPDAQGRLRLSRLQYLRAKASWDLQRVHLDESEPVRAFREQLDRLVPQPQAPALANSMTALRSYQQAGYQWLWFLHVNGFNGLLADEMGLGKTHQAMALLSAAWRSSSDGDLKSYGSPRPSLVVCPTTVLDHWQDKLRLHAPDLRCLRFYGAQRSKTLAGSELPPIVLTTYTMLTREPAIFEDVEWEYVVVDEAQKIKNPMTKIARIVKNLRARHRLALSGTPLENRPMELWSVFDFLLPGYLGSAKDFRKRFEIPLVQEANPRVLGHLKRLVHPFKLRRCKADVLSELPPKVEDIRFCELSPQQSLLYRTALERSGAIIERLRDSSRPIEYIHVFALLMRLKRICDHPALVLRTQRARALASGKFAAFQELIEEALASNPKIVVFSQYLEMLDILAEYLRQIKVEHIQLRGESRNRRQIIATFQERSSCRVFLASLLAGGLGIDLTAASVVIHYDRWWNAAREDQATDRVHRIGQSQGVQVFKLVTKGTLEERIHRMIERKRLLMNSLVASDQDSLKTFNREELLELLSVESHHLKDR